MAIFTMYFDESRENIDLGIPLFIKIETSHPSTVYYTLDGTTPNTLSDVFVDLIELPTSQPTVTLNAFAVFTNDDGAIEQSSVFSSIYTKESRGDARFLVFPFDSSIISEDSEDFPFLFSGDGSGVAVTFLRKDPEDVTFLISGTDQSGAKFDDSMIFTRDPLEAKIFLRSPKVPIKAALNDKFFNGLAQNITLDQRGKFSEEQPNIVMSAFANWFDFQVTDKRLFKRPSSETANNGKLVRTEYNVAKNIVVRWYYMKTTNSWIKVIGNIQTPINDLPSTIFKRPLIFKWKILRNPKAFL